MNRVIIYAKDVSELMGVSDKTARVNLQKIRKKAGKDKSAPVTAYDFSAMTGIEVHEVIRMINKR